MSTQRKIHVAVLYGGRSGEHEVSLQSAASVLRNLDPDRFIAIPVAIDKDGRWHPGDVSRIDKGSRQLPVFRDEPQFVLPPNPSQSEGTTLIPVGIPSGHALGLPVPAIDVVFPVLHGTFCEDGTLQGLLELEPGATTTSGPAAGFEHEGSARNRSVAPTQANTIEPSSRRQPGLYTDRADTETKTQDGA